MSYQVLARKWRPRIFSQVVGQEHVLRALINALDTNRLHHAYLFTGTRGVGKTTLGRILAKSLNCEKGISSQPCGVCSACTEIDAGRFVDLLEVDAASRTKVEDTRDLLENVQYAPSRGRFKIYLIDEVHMLSNHSFNALLKTLEEPPPHVKFILATTDPQKLLVTILSRCLRFNLKVIPREQIVTHLQDVMAKEQITAEADALRLIANAASGSMRDALSLLDQAIAYGSGTVRTSDVRDMLGTLDNNDVIPLIEALAERDGSRLLQDVQHLAQMGADFSSVLAAFLSLMHQIALIQVTGHGVDDTDQRVLDVVKRVTPEDVQLYYQIGLQGQADMPLAPDMRIGFEMTVMRMLAFMPVSTDSAPVKVAAPSVTPRKINTPLEAPRASAVVPPERAATENPEPVSEPAPASNDKWRQIVTRLNLGGLAKQLAVNCVLVGRDEDTLTLQLDKSNSQLANKNLVAKLQEAMQQLYNKPIQIKIEIGDLQKETPAKIEAREHAQKLQQATNGLENDPNVVAMKKLFNASLDTASVSLIDQKQ